LFVDLAARNVLLKRTADGYDCKISDFGMSRALSESIDGGKTQTSKYQKLISKKKKKNKTQTANFNFPSFSLFLSNRSCKLVFSSIICLF
jgi:hypothetical protein